MADIPTTQGECSNGIQRAGDLHTDGVGDGVQRNSGGVGGEENAITHRTGGKAGGR